jgi:hypothetical protein
MCHDVTAPDHDTSFAAADAAMEQAKEAALKIKHFHVILKKPGTAQLPGAESVLSGICTRTVAHGTWFNYASVAHSGLFRLGSGRGAPTVLHDTVHSA